MSELKRLCRTCAGFLPETPSGCQGECHANPPTVFERMSQTRAGQVYPETIFPSVDPGTWCVHGWVECRLPTEERFCGNCVNFPVGELETLQVAHNGECGLMRGSCMNALRRAGCADTTKCSWSWNGRDPAMLVAARKDVTDDSA
jgi:hypothetical protein